MWFFVLRLWLLFFCLDVTSSVGNGDKNFTVGHPDDETVALREWKKKMTRELLSLQASTTSGSGVESHTSTMDATVRRMLALLDSSENAAASVTPQLFLPASSAPASLPGVI